MPLLDVQNISKSYDQAQVLDRVSLSLDQGHILCLLGPSGCGKTTLLRIIAGLEKPDHGKVFFDGEDLEHTEPHKRRFGMMFQEFALFPHLDVSGNVSFGLRMLGLPRKEILGRTGEVLELMGLSGFQRRNVNELSGGERQRVALARSLAPRPRLLLLDEPLGSLDRALRERLMVELKSILKTVGATTIFVTHDQAEAYAVADVIAVMMEGRILQHDRPEVIYRRPVNGRVSRFLGLVNMLEGVSGADGRIVTPYGTISRGRPGTAPDQTVTLLIQPDSARVMAGGKESDASALCLTGKVKSFLFRGKTYFLEIALPGGTVFSFDLAGDAGPLETGQEIRLAVDPDGITVL
jgi:ABC-type Fe3+/spermidine/putrescine transport system ATPase subunit